ncbi:MAG: PAS domain S-box protein [Candidatus Binatia bacterium]
MTASLEQRNRAEEALRSAHEFSGHVVQSATDAIYALDIEGRFTFVNHHSCEITGYSREELLGHPYSMLFGDAALARVNELFRQTAVRGILVRGIELELPRTDGAQRTVRFSIEPLTQDGTITGVVGTAEDVTDRKVAELQLEQSRAQLRALSGRLLSIQEEERTRISREVHDELGQALTALKLDLVAVREHLPARQRPLRERTQAMINLVDRTIGSVQRIAADLRPGMLDDLGLLATIEWQLQDFQHRTGIQTRLRASPEDLVVDPARSTTVYRVLQEALTNVARHANAVEADVALHTDDGGLVLEVRDNGKGISSEEITNPQALGLSGMRERVRAWGGNVHISGIRGKGTVVTVYIPTAAQEKGDAGFVA